MPLSTLQCPGHPSTENDLAPNVSSAKAEKLASRPWVGLALQVELFSPDFFFNCCIYDQKAEVTETADDSGHRDTLKLCFVLLP